MNEQSKPSLRKKFLAKRKEHGKSQQATWDAALCAHLRSFLTQSEFSEVALFHPFRGEPDILALAAWLNSKGIATFLPRISGTDMHMLQWNHGEALTKNRWGIEEPPSTGSKMQPSEISCILTPALAISPTGIRLGYGGGFYDRYMRDYPHATYIGIVYSPFLEEHLPREAHDQKLNGVCSDIQFAPIK